MHILVKRFLAAGLSIGIVLGAYGMDRLGAQQPSLVDSHAFLTQHGGGAIPPVDMKRIKELVASMTLKEKVGQMTQLELGMVVDGTADQVRINPAKLRKAVVEYGVGSLLNVADQALPVERWRDIVTQMQALAAETRLKIPVVYGLDSIHGANYVAGATLFPQPLGMAATWNPQLMLDGSRIAAAETRAAGVPWNFSPVLDVGRQHLWPRMYETFGEDTYLTTVMGVASVRGYQGADASKDDRVAVSLKHYVGYSLPLTGHDRTPAYIPEIVMREHFLPPFAAAVKAGALTVMVNSGEVNGIPGHVNEYLLKKVLRQELGFDGVVVSDWEDIRKLVNIHRIAATEKEATRRAILAGIDMSMVPSSYSFSDLMMELAKEKAIPMSRIDEAVTRILVMKARMGLFDDPLRGVKAATRIGDPASRRLALDAARESIVLLKNDKGLLPLGAQARVLVTGPTADSLSALSNGWTITWQGDRDAAYPKDRPTVRGALQAALGDRVTYVPGASYDKEVDVAAAVAAARNADAVVLCLGEMAYAETPGDLNDMALPPAQIRLARELIATGKPVVLVLIEGRPRLIADVAEGAQAIVLGLNPSHEGGTAIADVLRGEVNPSGKLPITYPRFPNALLTYDRKAFQEQDTSFGGKGFRSQYEFGYGLSYTTFAYSDLSVTPESGALDAPTTVQVTVRNTGSRAGAEVVQLYVADPVATVTPPVKRLKRFVKVPLQPGESRTIAFQLSRSDLAFIGENLKPIAEPGAFTALVGGLKKDFTRK
jgi:beta-glucosidase